MKKSLALRAGLPAFFLLAPAAAVLAQTQLQEIVVTANRAPTALTETLRDVTVLTRKDIEQSGYSSLPDILSSVPGVQLSSPSPRGETASIFIRGTNNNHTLFLVDGQRMSSATTGSTAFAGIPLDQIERIEVIKGPLSSLYGSDAMGGVVQIFTRAPGAGAPASAFALGAGSYGTAQASASYGGTVQDTRFIVQAGREVTRGISQIKAPKNDPYDTYNADRDGYQQTNLNFKLDHSLRSDLQAGLAYFYAQGTKRSDNANCDANWVTCTTNFDNRDEQKQVNGAFHLKWQANAAWTSRLQLGRSIDELTSREYDPTTAITTQPRYQTTQDQLAWQNDVTIKAGKLILGVESRRTRVETTKSLVKDRQDADSLLLGYQGGYDRNLWQLSWRRDKVSDLDSQNSATAGYGYKLSPTWLLQTSIGQAFHAPTFNDLYWPLDPVNFYQGNPSLKPERSLNKEIGLRFADASTRAGITLYQNRIKDLIAYYTDPNTWMGTMNNIGHARTQGATLDFMHTQSAYTFRSSFDLLSARDLDTGNFLARRAPRTALVGLDRRFAPWTAGASLQLIESRFNDSSNKQRMTGYGLLNLRFSYQLDRDLQLTGNVHNALNRDYVAIQNTVTPFNEYSTYGRAFFLTLRYTPR